MRKLRHRRFRGMKGRAHEPGPPHPTAEIVELGDARSREFDRGPSARNPAGTPCNGFT